MDDEVLIMCRFHASFFMFARLLPLFPLAALACTSTVASAEPRHPHAASAPCDDDEESGDEGGSVDVTLQVKPNGVVEVHEFGGTLRVTTWAQSAVHVKGQFNPDCHVDITPSGDREQLRLTCAHGPGTGDLEVQIPQTSAVDVHTMSADVSVHDVSGAVHVQTVAGDIEVKGGAPSEIEARSTSGGVKIEASSASVRAHSISGDVSVAGVRGRATIRTVSGECTLAGGEFSAVEIESVSGDVAFRGGASGQGAFEVRSHSGDVSLHLPATTAADVEMRSVSGNLVIDMGSGRKTAEHEMDARIGAGGAKLRLRTFSGDIKVGQ